MKKICIVTGSRADYGLLNPIIDEFLLRRHVKPEIIVTGMHLSEEFGSTYKFIEEKYGQTEKVEVLLSSDTASSISKSIALGIIGFADIFSRKNFDAVIVLGDRYEIFAACIAAMNDGIPIAHIHGGETGAGTIDNMIRHSITKMSTLHFVSTEKYKKRVIQLGENPKFVFNVGAPGVEIINKIQLLKKDEIENKIDWKIDKNTILVTFHPLSLKEENIEYEFDQVLKAFDSIRDLRIIFTKSNADTGGRKINNMIDEYINKNCSKAISFKSLGTLKYLSVMKYVKVVVGNSSSGIIEAASLGTYTLDIGNRQKNREIGESVYHCSSEKEEISQKLKLLLSMKKQKKFYNPYAKEDTSKNIVDITLKNIDSGLNNDKDFYDLEVL